jgi:hypothetical protein
MRTLGASVAVLASVWLAEAATISLTASINVNKAANFTPGRDTLKLLVENATREGLDKDAIRFVQSALGQYDKLVAAKEEAERAPGARGIGFTSGMYKVKELAKLKAKKENMKKMDGPMKPESVTIDKKPYIVRNFLGVKSPTWNYLQTHWTLDRLMEDAALKKTAKVHFYDPDKYVPGESVDEVTLKRYAHLCFFSDKKQRLAGAQTEHCERTMNAGLLAKGNESDLKSLQILPNKLTDVGMDLQAWAKNGSKILKPLLSAERLEEWTEQMNNMADTRDFIFGPSGSGKNIHTQSDPYFDLLIHGQRRWLVGKTADLQEVAEAAAKLGGIAFERSTAYMFFEDKLPELKEEYGFAKFLEVNQNPGDLVVIPKGYSMISLTIYDAFSYRESIVESPKPILTRAIFSPPFQYTYFFCLRGAALEKVVGNPTGVSQVKGLQKKPEEIAGSWLTTVAVCSTGRVHGVAPQLCEDHDLVEACSRFLTENGAKKPEL